MTEPARLLADALAVSRDTVSPNGAVRAEPPAIRQLLDVQSEYLHLEGHDHVLVALATAVASRATEGEPLWVQIIGPPSSGKTEAVRMLDDVADAHPDEVTAPGLLSWSKGKEPKPVGILARLPARAFLTISDFSTVLATSDRGGRDQLFALMRRVYDGQVSRDLGERASALTWQGRVTILAACTPAIDSYSSHSDALGPRWVYCRVGDQQAEAKRATGRKAVAAGQLDGHRRQARQLAAGIVADATGRLPGVRLDETMAGHLVDAALVACYGRAVVERSGYGRREISAPAVVEEPPRLASQLSTLARALLALDLDPARAIALARRCALDSIPRARLAAIAHLARNETASVAEIARTGGCHRHVARLALDELDAIGIAASDLDPDDQSPDGQFGPRAWTLTGPEVDLVRRVIRAHDQANSP